MLYDRLKQIREAKRKLDGEAGSDGDVSSPASRETRSDVTGRGGADAAAPASAAAVETARELGAEWRAVSEFVFVRDTLIPHDGASALRRLRNEGDSSSREEAPSGIATGAFGEWQTDGHGREQAEKQGSGEGGPGLTGVTWRPHQLVFFDVETTGLSGGAGNVAFLAGFGRLSSEGISLHQVFLADYPGEPMFLRYLDGLITPDDVLVSYNGKSFDAQVLKTRFLMNGLEPLGNRHIDLLHTARRLWRRLLPDCSLGTVERDVLGVRRSLDIPGWEVPEAYFAYLESSEDPQTRRERIDRMTAVLAHHEQDIVSLVALMAGIEAFAGFSPEAFGVPLRVDDYELGRLLTRDDQGAHVRERGIALMHGLLRPNHPDALRAALHLGRLHRRKGRFAEAERVWRFAYERLRSVEAAIALAKLYEHRRRDPAGAAEIVGRAVRWPHARPYLAALYYRLDRLERKRRRAPANVGSAGPR